MTSGFSDPKHPIWALLTRFVDYAPALAIMLATINTWDTEFLLVAAIAAGREGSRGIDKLLNSLATDT